MKQFVKEFQANSSRGLAEQINDYANDGYKIVSLSITYTKEYGCFFHAIVVLER